MTEEMKNKTTEELLEEYISIAKTEEKEVNETLTAHWNDIQEELLHRPDCNEAMLKWIEQKELDQYESGLFARLNWFVVGDLFYKYGKYPHRNEQVELNVMGRLADIREPYALKRAVEIYGLEGEGEWTNKYRDEFKAKHFRNIALFEPNGYIQYFVSRVYQEGGCGFEKNPQKSEEYLKKSLESGCTAAYLLQAYNWIQNDETDKQDLIIEYLSYFLIYDENGQRIIRIDTDYVTFEFDLQFLPGDILGWLVVLPFYHRVPKEQEVKTILDIKEYLENNSEADEEDRAAFEEKYKEQEKELGMTIEEYYEKMSKEVKKMDTRICDKCKQPIPKESLFCPKCGAMQKIRSAADLERVQQWNVKEKEKIQAEMDTYAQTEIGKIEKAYSYFKKNAAAYDDFNRYVQMAGIASQKTPTKGMGCAVAVVAMFVVFPTLASIAVGVFQSDILVLISLIACIIASIAIYLKLKERSEMQIVDEQYEAEKKRNEALKKIQDYYRAYPGQCPVSIDYSHPRTLEYLYTLMNNRRADTVKEAINLMEEEMHRKRMETHQQELIYRTTQAGNAAQTAAFFSAMDFFTRR